MISLSKKKGNTEMSNVLTKLREDMKTAMKAKDMLSLNCIRGLINEINKKELIDKKTITDDLCYEVINGAVKQRKDTIEQFKQASRFDLSEKEEKELSIIGKYRLPQLSEDEIIEMIKKIISEIGRVVTKKDMGLIMGKIRGLTKNRADKSLVSSLVMRQIGG